jgi:hypothetical protein
MKIRLGHVSNSSSSSFLIYGVSGIGRDELSAAVTRLGLEVDTDVDAYELVNALEGYANNDTELKGLQFWDPGDDGEYYIGLTWDDVGDSETGKQFKTRAENALKKLLGSETEGFDTLREAWRDG